jgi:hypothetical protein
MVELENIKNTRKGVKVSLLGSITKVLSNGLTCGDVMTLILNKLVMQNKVGCW